MCPRNLSNMIFCIELLSIKYNNLYALFYLSRLADQGSDVFTQRHSTNASNMSVDSEPSTALPPKIVREGWLFKRGKCSKH